jgi:hypothetical protein
LPSSVTPAMTNSTTSTSAMGDYIKDKSA